MATADPWPIIHDERKALLADLEPLTDEQWATRSLCTGWSVRDVLGHMTATAKMTPAKFFAGLIGAGFRFTVMADKDIARETAGTPADTLARFREQLGSTSKPPGPVTAMVGEAVVHGEDIRRPLGITRAYPADVLRTVADFFKGSNLLLGSKRRIGGLTLRATDADWSTGTGPEVAGPMLSLVLMITGRKAALADLSGAGLATLQGRM